MKILLNILLIILFLGNSKNEEMISLKCMVEITDYRGEGAYFSISIIDDKDLYLKTVYVLGTDKTWFSEMKSFWKHLKINDLYLDDEFYPLIEGISGPTISGGETRILQLKIPKLLYNKTNRLRFETAVEDKGYYTDDINVELNKESLSKSYQGNGFIRNIKFILPVK
tara:strand:+ start:2409 stop:2912 length:504 start_codon:yes stop_codon:yes gene_type:complete